MNNFFMNHLAEIRKDFSITKKKIYLNNGSIAPMPLSTIKSITDFLLLYSEEGPDSLSISDFIENIKNELRVRISHLINCSPEEVIFTQSTTEGVNYVTNGLEWKKEDGIVLRGGKHEHYANYIPWIYLSKHKKIKIHELDIDQNGFFDFSDLDNILTKHNEIKLISLSHALYNNGSIMPINQVSKIAKEKNVLLFIDAAQSVGSIKVDVKEMGCDFLAFPAFKWICGPLGIGILYCSNKINNSIKPLFVGGESATWEKNNKLVLNKPPDRFQAGYRNYPGIVGMEKAVRYLLRIGIYNIRNNNMNLSELFKQELEKIPSITFHGVEDENKKTSIVSFSSNRIDSKSIVDGLYKDGILLAERNIFDKKIVRASPHFYNNQDEIIKTCNSIKKILN